MSKIRVQLFLCTGKDCRKAWARACPGSPAKWLKRQIENAGLPYKLNVVETACMDRCEEAACLCAVYGDRAGCVTELRAEEDGDRVLATLRSCVETAPFTPVNRGP
jgi:hypothetical protein